MKLYLSFLVFVTILLVFNSCQSDDTDDTVDIFTIDFNGISPTDANGQPTGSRDPSDWKLDGVWSEEVHALFSVSKKETCFDVADYEVHGARPNPLVDLTMLSFSLKDTVDVEFRIVDRNLTLLKSINLNDGLGFMYNELTLKLDDLPVKNDTVRIYYKFFSDDCEMRGHGDIVIIE